MAGGARGVANTGPGISAAALRRPDARTKEPPFAAVILAGGPGTRMANPAKVTLPVGGVAMLTRVLSAVADASPRIVVGAREGADLPADVLTTVEDPPGGGPAAATAAAIGLLGDLDGRARVAVLAGDLPFLTAADLAPLRYGAGRGRYDGAVMIDDEARPQWLCGVWLLASLRSRLAEIGDPTGVAMRQLVKGLKVARMHPHSVEPPAWFDCDTHSDLQRAEEWAHGNPG